ncbi:PVR cell adhesion molecule related 2 like isoform X2 [Misgurnus anguillicaudatus]|uniref:PVR cell adhesion molecule related 2 like isoform X2 n=1 Tax=Misgurnus anguillicaudatus TaxID=75329 RepID=UPI0024352E49|nr:PVR cell adhesion molecule related 2 like isoform X2 [Misgurnus anguillicaudatus]
MGDLTMRNCCLLLAVYLLSSQGVSSQRVRVENEVTAYPNSSVNLRCEFQNSGTTKLTQVSWMFERVEGDRQNIAVYHPQYGPSFPNKDFEGRVQFTVSTLENPSIKIDKMRMTDAGRYICEYATYPSGNEQGTTTLIMLARPKNSAAPVTVQAGSSEVVVARCEAAQGKPEATISWNTNIAGRYNHTSVPERDGTVTVKSEYRIVPTPNENGKEITCVVNQRTQSEPQSFALKLVVQYPPTVTIEGNDNNWFMGRTDAVLTCNADANPAISDVKWTTVSGQMPATVQVDQNKLRVKKVDETVNTTFICEVKNSLGSGKKEVSITVIESTEDPSSAGVMAGAILGSLLAFVLVSALVAVLVVRSRRQQQGYAGDGEQGGYGNKTRLFGAKKASKNGAGANNNGPIYTYREGEPGTLTAKCNEFPQMTGSKPTPHDILLSSELNEAELRKFDALNDSMEEEEEEDERYDRFGVLPPSYQIHRREEECAPYLDDDMESQRDGSIISRTAIYV